MKNASGKGAQTLHHEEWCDPKAHAQLIEDLGEGEHAYCVGHMLVVNLPDGNDLSGWWIKDGRTSFAVDDLFADFPPDGLSRLLEALDGATNPLAEGMRTLFALALIELECCPPAALSESGK